jgi:DNA-directed RNA polymerase specialized sigma24 family protein
VITIMYDTYGRELTSPDDRVGWLDQHCAARVSATIATTGACAPFAYDLADVYQESMLALLIRVRKHDLPVEEYLPVLMGIAQHKAVDSRRRRGRSPLTNAAAALSEVDDGCPNGRSYAGLLEHMGPAERHEFGAVLVELLAELPSRQGLVARLYILHFDEFRPRATFAALAALVSQVTGKREHPATVKSDWHAARAKLRAGLARRGYVPPDETDPRSR